WRIHSPDDPFVALRAAQAIVCQSFVSKGANLFGRLYGLCPRWQRRPKDDGYYHARTCDLPWLEWKQFRGATLGHSLRGTVHGAWDGNWLVGNHPPDGLWGRRPQARRLSRC